MYKITRLPNGEVFFIVSGRMDSQTVAELKTLFSVEADGQHFVLDLSELTLVDENAVRFLAGCETDGIELKNCPAYVREWITRERGS
jgi:anti-anti-sigma regulatory factor